MCFILIELMILNLPKLNLCCIFVMLIGITTQAISICCRGRLSELKSYGVFYRFLAVPLWWLRVMAVL